MTPDTNKEIKTFFKCFFGHDSKETGQRFIVDYGFGETSVRYGAYCLRCGKKWLERSHGAESWHPIDAIEEAESLAKIKIPEA